MKSVIIILKKVKTLSKAKYEHNNGAVARNKLKSGGAQNLLTTDLRKGVTSCKTRFFTLPAFKTVRA